MSHWIYKGQPFIEAPVEMAGFVYLITNTISNKKYIGKKIFWAKVTRPPLKGKKRKRRSVKDSGWGNYLSSSKYLLADIEELGKDKFHFEILTMHASRGELNYAELRSQVFSEVLEQMLPDGTRMYYNENIAMRHYHSDKFQDERNLLKEDLIVPFD